MNQPARKPGDAAGRRADSLPVDDPSIPVLTERLTLPPLDLNLDFRLPERPAASEAATVVAPAAQAPGVPILPVAPVAPPPTAAATPQPAEQTPKVIPAAQGEEDATLPGWLPPVEPPEPDDMPRVPTSLLVSNLDALLPAPPGPTLYREAEEFDITRTGGVRPNRMETDLREMILLEVARRLPTEVETIVRRHLEGAIEDAIRRFAAETRIALAASLREIIDRAVRSELERITAPRNRDG
ncbi:MAG TPA: hypothetical protein VMG60_00765 [Burkholderiaceae bacterium]|nr:hypothetical protein [Burkholderiaceae bacterium]